ncbi:LysR family transcriptional regulator [Streptomyces phytophilus]|uniref:LysR family transcriptional regulator n=1 Tax=Streptomyces phytophilus TaxID=722715 RepID=UPI002867D866|nr:LysR family transcriptional regulator [Streptomyces phytophilus]
MLRPALSGQGVNERLNRFAAASAYTSLSAAASGLGLNNFTLVAQINRIERELAGPLLVRAERGRPMTLTPLGRNMLRAIRKFQRDA